MAHIRGGLLGLYTQRRWVLRHAQRRYLYTRPTPPPNDLVHLQAKQEKPYLAEPFQFLDLPMSFLAVAIPDPPSKF